VSARVITYSYSYVPGEIDLCPEHADARPAWVPSLGQVQHGLHDGRCAACEHVEEVADR
jgi:hypothetical protein